MVDGSYLAKVSSISETSIDDRHNFLFVCESIDKSLFSFYLNILDDVDLGLFHLYPHISLVVLLAPSLLTLAVLGTEVFQSLRSSIRVHSAGLSFIGTYSSKKFMLLLDLAKILCLWISASFFLQHALTILHALRPPSCRDFIPSSQFLSEVFNLFKHQSFSSPPSSPNSYRSLVDTGPCQFGV